MPLTRLFVFTIGWSVGWLLPVFWGSIAWGVQLPWLLVALGWLILCLPLALVAYFVRAWPLLARLGLFICAGGAQELLLEHFRLPYANMAYFIEWPGVGEAVSVLGGLGVGAIFIGVALAVGSLSPTRDALGWPGLAVALAPLVFFVAAALLAPRGSTSGRNLSVGAIQLNTSRSYYTNAAFDPRQAAELDDMLLAQLNDLGDVELLLTHEEFDNRFHRDLTALRAFWSKLAAERRQALLVSGSTVGSPGQRRNSVIAFDSTSGYTGWYDKRVPAWSGESDLEPGDGAVRVLVLSGGVRVAPLICWESALFDLVSDSLQQSPNLLYAPVSTAFFGPSITRVAHRLSSQVRAAEAGLPLIWAANHGPSVIVNHWGRVTQRLEAGKGDALRGTVRLADSTATYLQRRTIIIVLMGMLSVVSLQAAWLRRRRALPAAWLSVRKKLVLGSAALVVCGLMPGLTARARFDANALWPALRESYVLPQGSDVTVIWPKDPENAAARMYFESFARYAAMSRGDFHMELVRLNPDTRANLPVLVQLHSGQEAIWLPGRSVDQLLIPSIRQALPLSWEELKLLSHSLMALRATTASPTN